MRRIKNNQWMFLFFCTISLVTNGICASYLAQNVGAKYTYFQELMGVPLAFLVAVSPGYFEKSQFPCADDIYAKIKSDILVVLVIVLLFSCGKIANWQSGIPDLREYSENYSSAYSIIDKYRREGPVFISSTLAEYASLYTSENVYYDWGQLVYCRGNQLNNKNGIMKMLFFDETIKMTTIVDNYLNKIDQMIINGDFSLITISSIETQINKSHLEENYRVLEEISLCHCVGQRATEQIWVKKDIIK